MKHLFSILLVCLSVTAFAQPVTLEKGSTIEIKASESGEITYTVIKMSVVTPPFAPVFKDPKQLIAQNVRLGGYIFPTDLSGKTDVVLGGPWPVGIALNGLVDPVRISNEGTVIIGSSTSKTHGIQTIGLTNQVTIAGKSFAEPMIIKAGPGQSGIGWNATGVGSKLIAYNLVFDNVGYADMLASSGSGKEYGEFDISFTRSKGSKSKTGEGFYFGHYSSRLPTRKVTIRHSAGMDIAREFVQLKWVDNFSLSNLTGYRIGFANENTQNHGIQIEASNGTVKDFILDGVPRGFNVFSHGDTIGNGYVAFTVDGGYFGDAQEAFGNDPRLKGKPIVIDGVDFVKLGPLPATYILMVRESTADIYVINCTFSPGTVAIFSDVRKPGYTNKLIGELNTHGNRIATVPAPVYISTDLNSVDFLKNTEPYHVKKGRGHLTPKQ